MKQKLLQSLPLAITIFALGILFGAGAKTAGISNSGAIFMSLFVFSGASQFAAVNQWSFGPISILISTAFLSSRFILMSASLSNDMTDLTLSKKALLAFGIIDESFGLYTSEKDNSKTIYTFGIYALVFYLSWLFGTAVGLIWGSFIPSSIQVYLGHIFPMVFVVLTVLTLDSLTKGTIALIAVLFFLITKRLIPAGWPVLISALLASLCGLIIPESSALEE